MDMEQLTIEQPQLIKIDQIISPTIEILDNAISNETERPKEALSSLKKPLDDLFPEQEYEEKKIQQTKKILGSLVNDFTSEQLRDTITEVQFLAESWLDDFERGIFGGLTLQEMLHERGGK